MPDPVVVISYDPVWPQRFADLGSALRQVLGDTALRVDHIGSTAVLRLAAKPIADVQISVPSLEPVSACCEPVS
jgi:GrpB-like predicted nucleotidyltransferase (UPF0157 family)